MRKLFALAFGIVLLSCQSTQKQSTVDIKNIEDGTPVYITEYVNGNKEIPVDTVQVKNEEVRFNLPEVDFQTLYSLKIKGVNGKTLFINENKPVTGKIYKDSIENSHFTGGEANKQFTAYLESLKKYSQKLIDLRQEFTPEDLQKAEVQEKYKAKQAEIRDQVTAERKKVIKDHTDVLSTIFVFGDLINSSAVSDNEMRKLFSGLSDHLKNTPIGKSIQKELEQAETVSVGEEAPDFSGKTPNGEEFSLHQALEAKGKYTLIEFWASWCPYCQNEMPNVVKVYDEYHEKGLNIISISLDDDKEEWVSGIKDFGMDWDHISHLKKWEDPIVLQYNVTSIPANFLLDEDGKIVAKDLQGKELRDKMKKLLTES